MELTDKEIEERESAEKDRRCVLFFSDYEKLEKDYNELKAHTEALGKENAALKEQNKTILEDNDTLNKWIDELKAQIEKMKNCQNCKKRGSQCIAEEHQGILCGKNKNKWELAE